MRKKRFNFWQLNDSKNIYRKKGRKERGDGKRRDKRQRKTEKKKKKYEKK